jgi:hypothetical protein
MLKYLVRKLGNLPAEAIGMKKLWCKYQPSTFMWHGEEHRVEKVTKEWESTKGTNGSTQHRRYFNIRLTTGKKHTIYQDLELCTWQIEL